MTEHVGVVLMLQIGHLVVEHGSNHDTALNILSTMACADLRILKTDMVL